MSGGDFDTWIHVFQYYIAILAIFLHPLLKMQKLLLSLRPMLQHNRRSRRHRYFDSSRYNRVLCLFRRISLPSSQDQAFHCPCLRCSEIPYRQFLCNLIVVIIDQNSGLPLLINPITLCSPSIYFKDPVKNSLFFLWMAIISLWKRISSLSSLPHG